MCSSILLPNDLLKKYNKAGILLDKKHYKEAIILYLEILKKKFEQDNYQISRIYNNIGYSYYKLNDQDKALNFYNEALKIDNNYVVCINNVAAILLNQKKYQEALSYLTKAYRLDCSKIKVCFNLFVAYVYLQNKEFAKYYLQKAIKIDRGYTIKRLKRNGFTNNQIKKIQNFK